MAGAVEHVQELTGLPCLPENPPATIFLGDLHILDYFARVTWIDDDDLVVSWRCPITPCSARW